MEKLFNNAGEKIKIVTFILFCLMSIACIVVGFLLFFDALNSYYVIKLKIWIGLGLLFLGPVVCWALCLFPYGFGVLVENSDKISDNSERLLDNKSSKNRYDNSVMNDKKQSNKKMKNKATDEEPADGFYDLKCPHCGEILSYTKEQLDIGELTCPMCDYSFKYKK